MSDMIPGTLLSTEKTGIFEEAPGVKSSKRIIGAALVGAGCLLLLATGAAAISTPIADASAAIECGKVLVYAGTACLVGGTAAEGIAKIGGAR